jgi:hypothetical protein
VQEVNVDDITAAITQSVAEHNRQIDALVSLFAETTTDFKTRFRTPTVARLEAIDEHGRATPIRPSGQYDIELPLQRAASALGITYEAGIKLTVGELNEKVSTLIMADMRWMRDHILAALFTNTPWTFIDDEHGNLTIVGLANGDSTVYNVFAGADNGTTDNHYFAQLAAIDDANNPFRNLRDEIVEHPENGGQVLAIVPTNLIGDVEGLLNFEERPDPNILLGTGSDRLVGSLGVAVPGEIRGYLKGDQVWISEWRSMPSDYIIVVSTEGERPLRMRLHPEAQLQGFNVNGNRNDWPYFEEQWVRRAGFGGWNRVAAAVQQIGSGTYAIPTGYASPQP